MVKVVTRHIWQEYKEQINDHRYEEKGKVIYSRRKETVERSFADGKELHGHRYARFRGLLKVQAQCLLSAACQNMKKIALIVHRKGRGRFFKFISSQISLQNRLYPIFRDLYFLKFKFSARFQPPIL
jgi:hypothetical protein